MPSPDDKAYALFRAVNCYAPSGANACGGKGVDAVVRKAWFQRLKRHYPNPRSPAPAASTCYRAPWSAATRRGWWHNGRPPPTSRMHKYGWCCG